jgi:lysophospholipase L1-like esterase
MAARQHPAPRPALVIAAALALSTLLVSGCRDSSAEDRGASGDPAASPTTSPTSPPTTPGTPGPPTAPGTPAPSATPRFARYVALGDSYTAAPGVPGVQSNDGCLRSSGNYPHLLAAALEVPQLVDVSCGGADTGDVRGSQLRGVAPQLDAVTRATDLVTIGMGGNDLQLFGSLLGTCVRRDAATATGTPCADELGPSVAPALTRIEHHLAEVVRAVRHQAPSATVVLVGYPQIVPASGRCPDVPFAAGDYAFARRVNRGLTEAVRGAAASTKTAYVDVWAASNGHDICSADPWVNGFSGPGAAPFHPFAAEQAAVAQLVAATLA